jgi:hypothetical protein
LERPAATFGAAEGAALGRHSLTMLFEGEMVDGIKVEHELRIRWLDGNGQSVFPGRDHVDAVTFIPLSENRLGRRVPIDLPDGQHLGTRDLPIFRSS